MKQLCLTAMSALALTWASSAQTCNGVRYASEVYPLLSTDFAVPYGENTTFSGLHQTLTLDMYQPAADTATARPLIIWAHGGSFMYGTSLDHDVKTLSEDFAKMGYVCASINYRLGSKLLLDSNTMVQAVIRAEQDMKAAIRFFYKDRLTNNTYAIDTNNIYIGGASAGAITALHVAYLRRTCEIEPYISSNSHIADSLLTLLGGIEGNSGNPCYSSTIKGVISLSGALGVYAWLEAGSVPCCSMHGTADAVVPYGRGIVDPIIPIMYTDGSLMINKQALAVGVTNPFYTWYGAKHVPFDGSAAYMDTTVNFIRDFLLTRLGIACTPLQPPDAPVGAPVLYAYTPCSTTLPLPCSAITGTLNYISELLQEVYPNPSTGSVNVVFANNDIHTIELFDIIGKLVHTGMTSGGTYTFEKGVLSPGIYMLMVSNAKGERSAQKIILY